MVVKISLIIPTKNEEKNIKELLKSIKKQKGSNYEIIVVDGGSTDRTLDIAKKYNAKIFYDKGGGPSKARNIGSKKAVGELIYFIDADWKLKDSSHLKKIADSFKDSKIKCAIPILQRTKTNIYSEAIIKEGECGSITGAYIFRKKFFTKLGGFNEKLGFGEDTDLAKRINKHTNPVEIDAVLIQKFPDSLSAIFKQGKWYGKGILNYVTTTKDFKPLISLIFWSMWLPALVIGAIMSNLVIVIGVVLVLIVLIKKYIIKSVDVVPMIIVIKTTRGFGEVFGLVEKAAFPKKTLGK